MKFADHEFALRVQKWSTDRTKLYSKHLYPILWCRIHPHALQYTCFGKPNPLVFRNAEAVLKLVSSIDQNKTAANNESRHFKTLYMIGDNPAVDINGANQVWWSELAKKTPLFVSFPVFCCLFTRLVIIYWTWYFCNSGWKSLVFYPH